MFRHFQNVSNVNSPYCPAQMYAAPWLVTEKQTDGMTPDLLHCAVITCWMLLLASCEKNIDDVITMKKNSFHDDTSTCWFSS